MFLGIIIILTLLIFLGIRFFISLNNMNYLVFNDVYKIVFIFSRQMYNLRFIIHPYDLMYMRWVC